MHVKFRFPCIFLLFSPHLVIVWDQSGSLPQTPEWYQATLTCPLESVGGCRALSELFHNSVYPPYCPAAPFRADPADIDHNNGCPGYAECCTEYGYCHPKVSPSPLSLSLTLSSSPPGRPATSETVTGRVTARTCRSRPSRPRRSALARWRSRRRPSLPMRSPNRPIRSTRNPNLPIKSTRSLNQCMRSTRSLSPPMKSLRLLLPRERSPRHCTVPRPVSLLLLLPTSLHRELPGGERSKDQRPEDQHQRALIGNRKY